MSHRFYVMRAVRPYSRGWVVRSDALGQDAAWQSLQQALDYARSQANLLRRRGLDAVVLVERPNGWASDDEPKGDADTRERFARTG